MSPPAWAYQVDSFDPPPDEELVCSICRGVFCDPVQCSCKHVYCRVCIEEWLRRNRNCPICRKRATSYSIEEVLPLVRNMIMKLQMRCHNSERGCQDKFSLEACESHVKECIYELVRCKNKPCKEKCLRKDIQDHELHDCPHHYVRCQKCNLKIKSKSKTAHDCLQSMKEKIKAKKLIIKKQSERIKELENSVKTLQELNQNNSSTFSDSDSSTSLSINDMFSIVSGSDSLSSSSDSSSYFSDTESDNIEWDPFQVIPQDDLTTPYTNEDVDGNTSVENPRNNVGVLYQDSAEYMETADVRRPPKRRFLTRILGSSDDDSDHLSLPSPKRNWSLSFQESPQTDSADGQVPTSSAQGPGASSADADSTVPSSVSVATAAAGGDSIRFRLRPRLHSMQVFKPGQPSLSERSNTMFRKTLALLEQYNMESDPEWDPTLETAEDRSDNEESFAADDMVNSRVSGSSDSSEFDPSLVYSITSDSEDEQRRN